MESNPNWNNEKEKAFQKVWAKLIAKAWSDPSFKEQLLKNPKAILQEQGIEFPKEIDCKITENTEKIVYLNIPKKPKGDLSEIELRDVSGGVNCATDCGQNTSSNCHWNDCKL